MKKKNTPPPSSPQKENIDNISVTTKSAEELAREWEKKKVVLPRMVFFYINLFQFCLPIFPLFVFDLGVYFAYTSFQIPLLYQIVLLPPLFILNYIGYIWFMAKMCKWLNLRYEKKSPAQEGVFSREFGEKNVADIRVHYYHLRGFLYKWPVFFSKKSPFPWTLNYVLREVGGNSISKNALFGDCFPALEFLEVRDNAVIMEGVSLSSHVVDSIFGALTIKKVVVEENVTIFPNTIVGPGAIIPKNKSIGPRVLLPKRWKTRNPSATFEWGRPVPTGKLFYNSLLEFCPEEYKKDWEKRNENMKTQTVG